MIKLLLTFLLVQNFTIIKKDSTRAKNEELGESIEKKIRSKLLHRDRILNYLILLNPASGTGQSLRLYEQFKQLMIEANIKLRDFKTIFSYVYHL